MFLEVKSALLGIDILLKPTSKTSIDLSGGFRLKDGVAREIIPIKQSAEELRQRAERGEFLFAQELAQVLGYSYSVIKQCKREGMPFLHKKTTKKLAVTWLEEKAKETKPDSGKAKVIAGGIS